MMFASLTSAVYRREARLPPWKRRLLTAYCAATMPWRRLFVRRAAARGRLPIPVLFYHRIDDDAATAWTMTTAEFAAQIDFLRREFELISLSEVCRRIASGRNDRRSAAITFDDGYADNCRFAIPLLLDLGLPFTYFVTLENVLRGHPFAHDIAMGRAFAPNTLSQIRTMADGGAEIGAHTATHCDLGQDWSTDRLSAEVVEAGRKLAELVGCPVRHFAFPFGRHENLNPRAAELARRAGYLSVCSAYGGYNWPGENPFHIRRIGANRDLIQVKNHLTFDPRKLNLHRDDPLPTALADDRPQRPEAAPPAPSPAAIPSAAAPLSPGAPERDQAETLANEVASLFSIMSPLPEVPAPAQRKA